MFQGRVTFNDSEFIRKLLYGIIMISNALNDNLNYLIIAVIVIDSLMRFLSEFEFFSATKIN